MKTERIKSWLVGGLLLFVAPGSPADEKRVGSLEAIEFFERKIRPVLIERCYQCHSAQAQKTKGGLLLDSPEKLLKGGDSGGPAVVPGDPEKSILIRTIRPSEKDLPMPPRHHRVAPEQIADFIAWVKMGAPDPRQTSTALAPAPDLESGRKFWSFQPLRDPPLPGARDRKWAEHPIDRFIESKWQAKGLVAISPADKRTLIRRASFDLIGLPPTPEEIELFVNDSSPKANEKLIERLLASPHYGERWGRHWLDLARYADTSGCNSDFPVSSAYKYRNYVIRSFNEDKPYDQFLREQIAGDLLPAKTQEQKFEQIIATGYLATSRRFGSNAKEFHLTFEDIIDNLGKGILGLTVSCARCHDHKYDPIFAKDYYALYGIFQSTQFAFPGTELYRHPKDFVVLGTPQEAESVREYETELAALDEEIEKLQEEKKALERLEKTAAKNEPPGEPEKNAPEKPKRTLLEVKAALEDARTRQRILESKPPTAEKAYAVAEGTSANARIQKKGDPKALGEEVPRGFLAILGSRQLPPDCKGSGRRELAQWLSDPKNPLTARVMVNRIWLYHFGKGLVQTPNDFGTRGQRPTHPELLDYLASRFIESGWSIKAMHRLIMLSRTYQLAGADHPTNPAIDLNNDYLWRFNRRRFSAEEIRDAMLAISGSLDRTMGGEHPFPPENDWRYTQHKPFIAVYESRRRSVYLMQQRIKKHPFLEIFDGADPNATTADRPLTTTPIQALFMINAPLVHEQADQLAVRVGMAYTEEGKRIDYAYRLAIGRPATAGEISQGKQYLRQCRQGLKETGLPADQQPRAALASYMRVLLSSNEFVYID